WTQSIPSITVFLPTGLVYTYTFCGQSWRCTVTPHCEIPMTPQDSNADISSLVRVHLPEHVTAINSFLVGGADVDRLIVDLGGIMSEEGIISPGRASQVSQAAIAIFRNPETEPYVLTALSDLDIIDNREDLDVFSRLNSAPETVTEDEYNRVFDK